MQSNAWSPLPQYMFLTILYHASIMSMLSVYSYHKSLFWPSLQFCYVSYDLIRMDIGFFTYLEPLLPIARIGMQLMTLWEQIVLWFAGWVCYSSFFYKLIGCDVSDSYHHRKLHFTSTLASEKQIQVEWSDFHPRIGGIWKEFYYLEGPIYKNDVTLYIAENQAVARAVGLTGGHQQNIELYMCEFIGYGES